MQGVKGLIVLSAVVVAVALGACRREEPAPLKLGADSAGRHAARSLRAGGKARTT